MLSDRILPTIELSKSQTTVTDDDDDDNNNNKVENIARITISKMWHRDMT
jgi:hypothetical protein